MESIHYLLMKAHTRLNKRIMGRVGALGLTPGKPKILQPESDCGILRD